MDEEVKKRLDAHDELLQKIYQSVEKTRKYFFWTFILSILFFILPLAGLLFVLPQFINTYTSGLGGPL